MIEPSTQEYFQRLVNSVPSWYYAGMSVLFCICISVTVLTSSRRVARFSSLLMLLVYMGLMLCSMVLLRNDVSLVGYNYLPFRSYIDYFGGNADYLLPQILLNILVFIPLGALLSLSFRKTKWWKLLLLGCCISIIIEFLQLLFQKGFCEIDDVLHNAVGCLIGILLFKGIDCRCRRCNQI